MVLMSAAIGNAAARVFGAEPPPAVVTTRLTLAQARDRLPILIEKYRANPDRVAIALASLPLAVIAENEYESHLSEAERLIGWRDPTDVDLLALALKLEIPVWTNDHDFDGVGVEVYPTARLLKALGL